MNQSQMRGYLYRFMIDFSFIYEPFNFYIGRVIFKLERTRRGAVVDYFKVLLA